MVVIQLVTVEPCKAPADCVGCARAEGILRSVAALARIRIAPHGNMVGGEFYLSNGRTVEAVHLDVAAAKKRGLDPSAVSVSRRRPHRQGW